MHIVIDARESGTTTGRYVDKLVEHLHKLKPTHTITLLATPERKDFFEQLTPMFHVAETGIKEFSLAEQLRLGHQISSLRPDLVHFCMVQQPILYRGRTVTTFNDLTPLRFRNPSTNFFVYWIKQRLYKFLNIYIARKTSAVITFSDYVREDIQRSTKSALLNNKCTTTPLASDSIPEAPIANESIHGLDFILYVGRPFPHKNLRRLLDAFRILQQSHPQLHLVLVGKKESVYAGHEKYISERGMQNIVFTDFVSEGQLRWLYENCRAYVFPSLSEGFGLPGLEAMVHGAPVVSSNATCLPEVYGDAAHYFDPLDVTDVAAKIDDVLVNKALRNDLIQRGRAQAKKYSWRRTAEQTLAVYEKVLRKS